MKDVHAYFVNPFICRWTLGLLLSLGSHEQCSFEYCCKKNISIWGIFSWAPLHFSAPLSPCGYLSTKMLAPLPVLEPFKRLSQATSSAGSSCTCSNYLSPITYWVSCMWKGGASPLPSSLSVCLGKAQIELLVITTFTPSATSRSLLYPHPRHGAMELRGCGPTSSLSPSGPLWYWSPPSDGAPVLTLSLASLSSLLPLLLCALLGL